MRVEEGLAESSLSGNGYDLEFAILDATRAGISCAARPNYLTLLTLCEAPAYPIGRVLAITSGSKHWSHEGGCGDATKALGF